MNDMDLIAMLASKDDDDQFETRILAYRKPLHQVGSGRFPELLRYLASLLLIERPILPAKFKPPRSAARYRLGEYVHLVQNGDRDIPQLYLWSSLGQRVIFKSRIRFF